MFSNVGKEMSGEEFNKMYTNYKFVKLTSPTENHNNFHFSDGMNKDTIQFNPKEECKPGGIYFTDINLAHIWIHYGGNSMRYYEKRYNT